MVCHGPYRSGRSRHGAPVRSRHPVEHLPVITPRTTTPVHLGQKGLYSLPRRIRQLASTRHKINYHPTSVAHEPQVAARRCRARFQKHIQVEQGRPLPLVRAVVRQDSDLLASDFGFLLVELGFSIRVNPAQLARSVAVERAERPCERFAVCVGPRSNVA